MPIYQFVLKETQKGTDDHNHGDHHLQRRATAVTNAHVRRVDLTPPRTPPTYQVPENLIGGVWHYTWVVEAPDIKTVQGAIDEFVFWGWVELSSGPELSQIKNPSVKLGDASPNP